MHPLCHRIHMLHAIQFQPTHAPSLDASHKVMGGVARLSSCSRISYGTLAVRSFHLTTQHPHSRHEGEHKPIQAVSLCSVGKSVGSTLTLGTSSPVHVGPAGWCLVTATYGHAAASMNVFELQLLRRRVLPSSSGAFRSHSFLLTRTWITSR